MKEGTIITNLSVDIKKENLIKGLSIELNKGTITCIVAPNGTGKTTLFKALANLLPIKTGNITINSESFTNKKQFNKNFFFLENSQQLVQNLTAHENMRFISKLWEHDCDINKIIDFVGIRTYKDKKIKCLSLGMKQKVLVAVAIASGANFIIFDEPLNGLDIENIENIATIFLSLKKEGKTLLLSSHNIFETSKICDTIYFLVNGSVKEASLDYKTLKEQYNSIFTIRRD
ncbi:ABC transporter ATP-binding protein [Carnobacterium divergens]|uniref:ATP-binding cassette domain-containing protein n=3 Tax=Carnobacterium divergens TaxID=2748 RepID=UPI000D48F509|nr:ABC transporter ATP-binding protein [Carnobacterium divergens]MCO6016902.1 ABC transporter ATP-binding protein [Carnobacterium divergens]TFI62558.1 ABC transporter ATP-binding protein [Carnobacterium divergens]TFI89760.1 ABC transporter ATP-binding protein [Carnobacterium divergens]TFJ04815.1 ABC transporter ATP-binding protein [Carnobacterium divergens]TFJ06305.1 ABC transporter ATP-binding protein [Carnobacterium divergens]